MGSASRGSRHSRGDQVLRLFRDTVRGAVPVPGGVAPPACGRSLRHHCLRICWRSRRWPASCSTPATCNEDAELERLHLAGLPRSLYTDLPNRWVLLNRVESALARSARSGAEVALLFVDLDDFKMVNDSLGHSEGDRLLVAAGERLGRPCAAATPWPGSGATSSRSSSRSRRASRRSSNCGARPRPPSPAPFELQGHSASVGASIGIARSHPGQVPEELLRNADVAMYAAKAEGEGGYQFFAPEMQLAVRSRPRRERPTCVRVFAASELCLSYQPIFRLVDRRLDGFEALLALAPPHERLVSPDLFIATPRRPASSSPSAGGHCARPAAGGAPGASGRGPARHE